GGVAGYVALNPVLDMLPFALAFAAASMLYVAIADLIPGLHRRVDLPGSLAQVALIAAGVVAVLIAETHAH
ncbi:MAG: hypothetical protein NZM12_06615, partial [Steroidobacteraceae bacterium]|nr:hypothetical protein [Steroidobacteraceae bacterium]